MKNGFIDKDGYKVLRNGEVKTKEHRKVYEDYWNVKLTPDIEIHHMNRDRRDNRIENLVAMTRTNHLIAHGMVTKLKAIEIVKNFFNNHDKHTIKEFEDNMNICIETITRKLGNWTEIKKKYSGKTLGI